GNGQQNRVARPTRRRDPDEVRRALPKARVVLTAEGDNLAVAGFDLLEVRHQLFVVHVPLLGSRVRRAGSARGSEHEGEYILVDERDGPVLELARRVALRVEIGDLLQLEGALERHRVMNSAADEKEAAIILIVIGKLLHLLGRPER